MGVLVQVVNAQFQSKMHESVDQTLVDVEEMSKMFAQDIMMALELYFG